MAEPFARLHQLRPPIKKHVPFMVIGTSSALRHEVEQSSLQQSEARYIDADQLNPLPIEQQIDLLAESDAILVEWHPNKASLFHHLRSSLISQHVPLVAVCGPDETDHVAALVIGADDIIERPLNPVVIKAKLRAYRRLRSHRPMQTPLSALPKGKHIISFDPLVIDKRMRCFYIQQDAIELTRIEFDLMLYMMEHAGECKQRDEIINTVWDTSYAPSTNILDVHIYSLRNKLKVYELGDMLQTVRGVGYRLVAHASE